MTKTYTEKQNHVVGCPCLQCKIQNLEAKLNNLILGVETIIENYQDHDELTSLMCEIKNLLGGVE